MNLEIEEIVEILEGLVDDLSSKPKLALSNVIAELKEIPDEFEISDLMKIQEDLESVSLMANLDSFSRNEIINVLSMFETLF